MGLVNDSGELLEREGKKGRIPGKVMVANESMRLKIKIAKRDLL